MTPGRRGAGRHPTLLLLLGALSCGGGDSDPGTEVGDAAGERAGAPRAVGGAAAPTAPDTVLDAEGRTVVLGAPPARIVSLVPSATATLIALGARDRLVGRTEYDTATALADLPSVGGGLMPSAEVLLSLRPDLVVRFAGESDRDTPALLDEAGVPHLAVRPERIEDAWQMIRTLGRVVDRSTAADSILARHRSVLDSVRRRVEGLDPVTVAFTLGGETPWVAGPGTFAGELLTLAGGRNVFDDLGRPWAGVGPETFLERDPEIVLVMEGARLDERLARGRTVREVPPLVQLPGPDLDRAALAIAQAVRPAAFGGRDEGGGA